MQPGGRSRPFLTLKRSPDNVETVHTKNETWSASSPGGGFDCGRVSRHAGLSLGRHSAACTRDGAGQFVGMRLHKQMAVQVCECGRGTVMFTACGRDGFRTSRYEVYRWLRRLRGTYSVHSLFYFR